MYGINLIAPGPIPADTLLKFGPVKQPELGIRISKAYVKTVGEHWPGGYSERCMKPGDHWIFRIDTTVKGQQYFVAWEQPPEQEKMDQEIYVQALAKLLERILKNQPRPA